MDQAHRRQNFAALILLLLLPFGATALPNLTEFIGVEVDGVTYDVAFKDGTCAAIFGGCDQPADFTFTSASSAQSASQALVDQVFVGAIDNDPNIISGCTPGLTAGCNVMTPYATTGTNFGASVATNNPPPGTDNTSDLPTSAGLQPTTDFGATSLGPFFTFAEWTVSNRVDQFVVDPNGQLLGARNINVMGNLFDVNFADGTCALIFGGCNDLTDFVFQTAADAQAASQALIDQVFVGQWGQVPTLMLGCDGGTSSNCLVMTPYATNGTAFGAYVAENRNSSPDTTSDLPIGSGLLADTDFESTGLGQSFTFARWTPVTFPVPEPTSVGLLVAGVAALRFARHGKRSGVYFQ